MGQSYIPVSYTHLDVYKRQSVALLRRCGIRTRQEIYLEKYALQVLCRDFHHGNHIEGQHEKHHHGSHHNEHGHESHHNEHHGEHHMY